MTPPEITIASRALNSSRGNVWCSIGRGVVGGECARERERGVQQSGKLHFGYIYGIGLVGCVAMYCLLNLMSMTGVSVGVTISVLGYCLLPMVILSFAAVLLSLTGVIGIALTCVTVAWCSLSASKLFVSALAMDSQQPLVAYPCALVYGVFALITVF
ncbi:hypothetical protein BaRGS_00005027 [Batillaria attramentaria]|uniref:Protein YIPF n=1 Tax=Batillaria attramentaria TaxID=370345 RepID=A0ABD0LY00_9CAEN